MSNTNQNNMDKLIHHENVTAIVKVAELLARTGWWMSPDRTLDQDKRTAQNFARIMAGAELGIPPMRSMQSVHIIKDKTSLHYALVAGLIRKHPLYEYDVIERSNETCILEFFREGKSLGKITKTISQFQDKIKDDSEWSRDPATMLFARAITNGTNTYCPDVTMGAIYSPQEFDEEVSLEEPEDTSFEIVEEPFTDDERKKLHMLGSMLYGELWNEKRPPLVEFYTNNRTSSSQEMTKKEMLDLIVGLDKQLKEKEEPMITG